MKFYFLLLNIFIGSLILASPLTQAQEVIDSTLGSHNHIFLNEHFQKNKEAFFLARYNKNFTEKRSSEFLHQDALTFLVDVQSFLKDVSTPQTATDIHSSQTEVIRSAKRFNNVDLYQHLEKEENRERSLREYIAISQSFSKVLTRQEKYLESMTINLSSEITNTKNNIDNLNASLKSSIESGNTLQIDSISSQILQEKASLAKSENELTKSQILLDQTRPLKNQNQEKRILLEKNYKQIIFNIPVEGL